MSSIGMIVAQAAGGVAGFLLGATGIVVCLVIMWMLTEYKNTLGPDGLIERKWIHGGP